MITPNLELVTVVATCASNCTLTWESTCTLKYASNLIAPQFEEICAVCIHYNTKENVWIDHLDLNVENY